MKEEKAEIFTVKICDKKNGKPIKFEGDFLKDIFKMFHLKFPNTIDEFPPDRLSGRTVKVEKDSKGNSLWSGSSKNSRVAGIISLGRDKDKVLKFTRANKKKTPAGQKEKGVTVDKPYYFDIIFSENKTIGFLVLQRTDNSSCKAVFKKLAQTLLDDNNGSIKIVLNSFIEKELFQNHLRDGEYNEIEFVKNGLSEDLMEQYLGDYAQEGKYKMSVKLKAEGDSDFDEGLKSLLYNAIENDESFLDIPELGQRVTEDNPDLIKIRSTFNGKKRTIDLSNTLKVQPFYQLGEVDKNEEGFVSFSDIRSKTSQLLLELNIDIL